MRLAMSDDCTGEPPGELTASATALMPPSEKARSSVGARPASDSPLRSGPIGPITPLSRTTATIGAPRSLASDHITASARRRRAGSPRPPV
jgi:hypothetical protein